MSVRPPRALAPSSGARCPSTPTPSRRRGRGVLLAPWVALTACTTTPPSPEPPAPPPACATCHPDAVSDWQDSHHALAATAAAPAEVHRPPGHDRDLPTVAHVGVSPLWQPVVRRPDGSLGVSTGALDARTGEAFVVPDPLPAPGTWGDWRGHGLAWTRCTPCHTTAATGDVTATHDPGDPARVLGVTCAACHGAATAHARDPDAVRPPSPPATGRGACGPCHTRGLFLDASFPPAAGLLDALVPSLPDPTEGWHVDGQVHDETFEGVPFLSSAHARAGLRCTTCHTPHTARLRQPATTLCTTCHPSPTGTAHALHPPGTDGPDCVACHLPTTTYMGRHTRHDHGLHIPDPTLARRHGTPIACDRCHEDRAVLDDPRIALAAGGRRALADTLARHHTTPPPADAPPGQRAAWIAALPADHPARAAAHSDPDPLIRLAAATGAAPETLLPTPGLGDPVPAVAIARRRAVTSVRRPDDPAMARLTHWLASGHAGAGGQLELAAWADHWGDEARRTTAVARAAALDPGDPQVLREQAIVQARAGHLGDAEQHLSAAVALHPDDPGLRVAHARVLHDLGRGTDALSELATGCVLTAAPDKPACARDHALLLHALGRTEEALSTLPDGDDTRPLRAMLLRDAGHLPALRALCATSNDAALARVCRSAGISARTDASDDGRSPPR